MPPFGGISSPPCISFLYLMIDGAATSLPAWGPSQMDQWPIELERDVQSVMNFDIESIWNMMV
jgi:hypothetical protein